MNTPDSALKRAAEALGAWRDPGIDQPTATLLLLGHASGLRLDLGECSACRKRGSKRGLARWEWTQRFGRGRGAGLPGWSAIFVEVGKREWARWVAFRPCPACTVDGKPTGRESIDWATPLVRALQPARSLSNINAKHGRGECSGCGDLAALTKGGLVRSHTGPGAGPRCSGTGKRPRASTREGLDVLADFLQASGDVIGTWTAEWLAGSCRECNGVGSWSSSTRWSTGTIHTTTSQCPCCNGHGTMLGAHEPALVEALVRIADRGSLGA